MSETGLTVRNGLNFDAGIRGEAAIGVDADGPDLGVADDRVIQPALVVGQAPDAPLFVGHSPGCRVRGVKRGAGDVHPVCRIHDNRGQTRGGTAFDTVVECAQIIARQIEAVDHAGVLVGHVKLIVGRVERDVAETGAAVRGAAEDNIGKDRNLARCPVDTPHGARSTAEGGAELTFHETGSGLTGVDPFRNTVCIGIGGHDLKAKGARRRRVDVWIGRIVQRHAEHLPNIAGKHL